MQNNKWGGRPPLAPRTAPAQENGQVTLPRRYANTYFITVNSRPPEGAKQPQLAIISADKHTGDNMRELRLAMREHRDMRPSSWHVISLAYSQEDAENHRRDIDRII